MQDKENFSKIESIKMPKDIKEMIDFIFRNRIEEGFHIYPTGEQIEYFFSPVAELPVKDYGKDSLEDFAEDSAKAIFYNSAKAPIETFLKMVSRDFIRESLMVVLATALKEGSHEVTLTPTEKLRLMGYSDEEIRVSGKLYKRLYYAEKALLLLRIKYNNGKIGDDNFEFEGRFYSTLVKIGFDCKVVLYQDLFKNFNLDTKKITGKSINACIGKKHRGKYAKYKNSFNRYLENNIVGQPATTVNGLKLFHNCNLSRFILDRRQKRDQIYTEVILPCLKDKGIDIGNKKYNGKSKDMRVWEFNLINSKAYQRR